MIRDWFRARRELVAELVEAREQCVHAGKTVAAAAANFDHYRRLFEQERTAHAATVRRLDALSAEIEGRVDVFEEAPARTAGQELAAMKTHAAALEQRVHLLQRANMAADRR